MTTEYTPNFAEWVLREKQLERYCDRLVLADPSLQIQAIYHISELLSHAERSTQENSENADAEIDYLTICGIAFAALDSFSHGKTSTEPGKRALNVICDLQHALSFAPGEWIPYNGPTL